MFSKQIIILKKKYFHQHWNTLEFFIVLIGIVDVFCIYFVRLRPDNLILIQFTVIIGYFRIIRFFPLLKVKFHINFFFLYYLSTELRKLIVLEEMREGAIFSPGTLSPQISAWFTLSLLQVIAQLSPSHGEGLPWPCYVKWQPALHTPNCLPHLLDPSSSA